MKTNQKNKFPYAAFDTFCVRTPLLPLDFYLELLANNEVSDEDLQKHFSNAVVSEAIYLASPELYEQLKKWKEGHITDVKKVRRLRNVLMKYLTRMSTRCTPFGLFAAVGTGTLDQTTQLELKSSSEFVKRAQYDMQYLAAFANYIVNKPNIKKQLLFFPNSSLYRIGQRYRYVEYTYEEKQRTYSLESVAHSRYLESLLISARNGITLDALIASLVSQEIEPEEAIEFIDQLVDNQILVSELEPTITGNDFLQVLKDRISVLQHAEKELKLIDDFLQFLQELNTQLGSPVSVYKSFIGRIEHLDIPFEKKYLIQVDTYCRFENSTLGYENIKNIRQCMAFLNKIKFQEPLASLSTFKRDFNKRYEHQKVPLLQLLDVETGIGYGQNPTNLAATPFLDDIVYYGQATQGKSEVANTALYNVLQSKLVDALSHKQKTIELSDSDFPQHEYNWENAPNTVSVIAEFVSLDEKDMVVMSQCLEHAGRLLGRFGHGSLPLENLLYKISEKEAAMNPNHLLAEIVHLPEARTGNILRRPVLRKFEIPYLGKSNLPKEQQIPLEDILVSVDYDVVVLHSKRQNKRILPKLSNAHNFAGLSLPIYRFLCDLQYQEQRGFGFNWPRLLSSHPFLPRVTYKNCILSKATWHLKKKQIETLLHHLNDKPTLLTQVSKWREVHKIPEMVQVVNGDNTLVVNLNNYTSLCMFVESVKNKSAFILEEFLWQKVSGSQPKNQSAEFVISFFDQIKLNSVLND